MFIRLLSLAIYAKLYILEHPSQFLTPTKISLVIITKSETLEFARVQLLYKIYMQEILMLLPRFKPSNTSAELAHDKFTWSLTYFVIITS